MTLCLYFVHSYYVRFPLPIVVAKSDTIRNPVSQISALLPQIPPGSRVLFLDDPFPTDNWNLYFLVRLCYNDKTLVVERSGKKVPASDSPEAAYDILIGYKSGKYFLVKQPSALNGQPHGKLRGSFV